MESSRLGEDDIMNKELNTNQSRDNGERIVIIGTSSAGASAATEIRKLNKTINMTMISKEEIKGYYRPMLPEMISNENISIERISIKKDQWFEDNNIDLILNKVVSRVDSDNKKVILENADEIAYTKLIIATGADAFVPPFKGRDKEGVFTFRSLADVNAIKKYVKGKKTGVVIGGGILGLEAAFELYNRGLNVTIVEMADRILPIQLDNDAANILEDTIKEAGVTLKMGLGTKEILGDKTAQGILLENGETIDADIVIITTGVIANIQVAKGSDIETESAIVVNERMETSVKDIYAGGDCAQYNGINCTLWRDAVEQGKTAGINSVGGNHVYKPIVPSTVLNVFDINVFSIGDIGVNPDLKYKTYENIDGANYKKLYFEDGVIVGGILIGDTSKKGVLNGGINKRIRVEEMIEKINHEK